MAEVVRRRKSRAAGHALAALLEKYIEASGRRNYSEYTLRVQRMHIGFFLDWAAERGITEPAEVTRTILEQYQRITCSITAKRTASR